MQHFLFLQVPHGPFVNELEVGLETLGHKTTRLLFNAGDWLYSQPDSAIFYRGSIEDLNSWLQDQQVKQSFTDIVVYGDCRAIHRCAKQAATQLGCRFWVLEEGYLRPSWVTLERYGANGHSKLPELFQVSSLQNNVVSDESIDIPAPSNFGKSQRYIMLWAILYYGCRLYFDFLFRSKIRTHRPNPFIYEFASWHIKLAKKLFGRDYRHRKICRRFIREEKFFFVPLQLVEDSQIEVHSQFDSIYEFIDHILDSFVRNANPNHKLLFKGHPLDSELINYRKYIITAAKRFGLENRVTYIHDGVVPNILDHAMGTVTVNSTVGLQAIHHRCPVMCIGSSIYNHSELTFSGTLDQFWVNPSTPDNEKYRKFRNFLHQECLVAGGFYRTNAIKEVVAGLVEKLTCTSNTTNSLVEETSCQMDCHTLEGTHKAVLSPIKKVLHLPTLLIPIVTIPVLSVPFFVSVVGIRLRAHIKARIKKWRRNPS